MLCTNEIMVLCLYVFLQPSQLWH